MCIGEPFAKLEGAVALAILAQRWKLQTINPDAVEIGAGFLLRPEEAIRMRLSRRPLAGTTDTGVTMKSMQGAS